jgi:hypothetical protein
MTETKIVELIIQDENQELAIDAISLVTSPAIESEFVFFGKEKNNLTFAKVDEEKRMLVSPALIPNKQIFRHDPNTDSDYYVFFSKATVRKASELYLKHNNHHKATYQHQDRVSGVLTVESWIIEDTKLDKSTLYGYSLPVGTWMVKLSISNDEIWSKIKSGELRGLSIEGYFTNKFEQMNKKKEFTNEEVKTALKELLSVQKVELSIAGDIQKQIANIKAVRKSVGAATKAFKKAKDDALNVREEGVDAYQRAGAIREDAMDASKELGIKPEDIKGFKVMDDTSDDLFKEYQDLLKLI